MGTTSPSQRLTLAAAQCAAKSERFTHLVHTAGNAASGVLVPRRARRHELPHGRQDERRHRRRARPGAARPAIAAVGRADLLHWHAGELSLVAEFGWASEAVARRCLGCWWLGTPHHAPLDLSHNNLHRNKLVLYVMHHEVFLCLLHRCCRILCAVYSVATIGASTSRQHAYCGVLAPRPS